MDTGALAKVFVSSLAAFWPGMQALIGAHLPSGQRLTAML
jgi:hypothetical protein